VSRFFGIDSMLVRATRMGGSAGRAKTIIGGSIVGMTVLVGLLAPPIPPYGPDDQDLLSALSPPTWSHPFGTDQFGRDVLSRTLVAARLHPPSAGIPTGF